MSHIRIGPIYEYSEHISPTKNTNLCVIEELYGIRHGVTAVKYRYLDHPQTFITSNRIATEFMREINNEESSNR